MSKFITAIFLMVISQSVTAISLDSLINKISRTAETPRHFTEKRTADFLAAPVITKGSLEFKAPNTLVKRTTQPDKTEQRIEGDVLLIYQDGEIKETISLLSYPELAIGINAIRWMLSGDLISLHNHFIISVENHDNQWLIMLTPKQPEVISEILSLSFIGSNDTITHIEVKQSNGDLIKTELYEQQ
jgi:hypothetical protein